VFYLVNSDYSKTEIIASPKCKTMVGGVTLRFRTT